MGNNSLFHPIWWCSCLKIRFSNNGNMSKWSKGWGQLQIPIYKTGLGGSLLQEVYFWKVLTCLVIVCKLILCLTWSWSIASCTIFGNQFFCQNVFPLCVYFGGGYEDCLYRPYFNNMQMKGWMLDCKTDQTQTRTFNKTKGSDQGNRYDDYRSRCKEAEGGIRIFKD